MFVEIVVEDKAEAEAEDSHDGTSDELAADEAGTAESAAHSMDTPCSAEWNASVAVSSSSAQLKHGSSTLPLIPSLRLGGSLREPA